MKLIKLNLLCLTVVLMTSSLSATNPIPQNFSSEYVKEIDNSQKHLQKGKLAQKLKKWYQSVKNYFQLMTNRGRKFLIAWLGLSAFSVVSFILGYIILFAFATEIAFIIYLLLFLLSLAAGAAAFVFFILWLVDLIQTADQGGVRAEDPHQQEKPERIKRKKKRRR